MSVYLSIYLSIHLSIYPSIRRSIHPSIYLSIYRSIDLPIYLSTYLCVHLYIHTTYMYRTCIYRYMIYDIWLYGTGYVSISGFHQRNHRGDPKVGPGKTDAQHIAPRVDNWERYQDFWILLVTVWAGLKIFWMGCASHLFFFPRAPAEGSS